MTTCVHCGEDILGPDTADMYWHADGFLRCPPQIGPSLMSWAEPETNKSEVQL